MNKWDEQSLYISDMINAMMKYALSVNQDKDSNEFKNALFEWATYSANDFKKQWKLNNILPEINGSLNNESN